MTPRAPSFPLLGSLPYYLRDPLAFLCRAATRGPIVDLRLPGMKAFLLSDPADIQHVLTTNSRHVIKDVYLRDLRRVVGQGLLTSEGEFWRRQRRLAQPPFHRDRLASYAQQMVASAERTAADLHDGETRDVHPILMKLTLDIVTRTLFGSGVEGDERAIGEALHALMERYASALLFLVPGYDRLPLAQNRRFREAMRVLDSIILRIIDERRRAGPREESDLLAMLLAAQDDDGGRMTDTQLRDEVMTLFLAGHETTANALAWTLMLLAKHPAVEDKLHATLASVLGDRAPTLDDVPRLTAVEDVVTEAMRLYPPAWAIGREVVEPFEMHGTHFPRGTQLWMSQWVSHRDARYFDDPEAFRPERWADGLAKRLPKFAYYPFGGGPRVCIGTAFATMETTLVLATLARQFRFELAPGKAPVPVTSVTLRPRDGLRMIVRRRGIPSDREGDREGDRGSDRGTSSGMACAERGSRRMPGAPS